MITKRINILTRDIIRIIGKYDMSTFHDQDRDIITDCVKRSLIQKKPVEFIEFTCSTINSTYMFSRSAPEKYVSLSPEGNNLTDDIPTLLKFLNEISEIYPVKLIMIIGNTDPYYIYTCGWSLLPEIGSDILWKRFAARWLKYKNNLDIWLKKRLPYINYQLISWYELEREQYREKNDFNYQFLSSYKNINIYFPEYLFGWELNKLAKNFGPEKYFNGLKKPSVNLMKDWVKRKFAEYAVQGLWIKTLYPSAILLQNEKPSSLRTLMYQPLIIKRLKTRLPVIYPFGVDDTGFR